MEMWLKDSLPFSTSTFTAAIFWVAITSTALLAASFFFTIPERTHTNEKIPCINPRKWYDIGGIRAKLAFAFGARKMLTAGALTGRPFRLLTDSVGEIVVLPAHYAYEIRSDPRLSFSEFIEQNFHGKFTGFEGFRHSSTDARVVRAIANNQLRHSLDKLTEALSEECATALQDLFPASEDWSDIALYDRVLQLVARLSSRVFIGEDGPRSRAWLKITTEYTTTAYIAVFLLRLWPSALRPIAYWCLPQCRKLRSQVAEARRIIIGIIEARKTAREVAAAEGRDAPEYNDVIAWVEQDMQRKSQYDPVVAQMIFAQAAIETTSDFLTQVILDIAQHREVIEPLREEIAQVICEGVWKKSSLYDMKLLDSVLKESQRLKPLAIVSMLRMVVEDMTLSNDTHLTKGQIVGVSGDRMWDATIHEDPEKFDGYRFARMRDEPGPRSNQAHFVSTNMNHLAFGFGENACAGRFFVAQEIKIALSHLLLKYDWKIPPSSTSTRPLEFGLTCLANTKAKISIRRRKAEVEI